MKIRPEIKYSAAVIGLVFLFSHFIACGSQFYKVSVEDDHSVPPGGIPAEATNPNSPNYGLHALGGWTKLPVTYYFEKDMTDVQKEGIQVAMSLWEKATCTNLFELGGTAGKKGDDFSDLYSSLADPTNAFYLDYNWAKTGKSTIVLATTIWNYSGNDGSKISMADMRYNREEYRACDALTRKGCPADNIIDSRGKPEGAKEIYDIITVAIHEIGHFIGLLHIDEKIDSLSIMNPSIYIGVGLAARNLSIGDIQRVRKIYPKAGCRSPEAIAAEIQKEQAKSTALAH